MENHHAEGRSCAASTRPCARDRVRVIAAAVIAMAALTGCQSMSMNSAKLRVIDVSSNTGPVDSYQDSTALAYNLEYGTVTSYVPSVPGTSTLALDKAGTRQTLASAESALAAGKQYTEIVTGSLANMQQTTLLDQSTPAPAGQTAIRLVNEASTAGSVDVYLIPPRTRLSTLSPVATNLAVGANPGYVTVPDGTYSISVLPTSVPPSSSAKLFTGPQVEYPSGSVRTVVLIDKQPSRSEPQSGSQTMQAVTATDVETQ
jgi:hypothetical protein